MAATKSEITTWFKQGVNDSRARMIVWCDTYDWEDYPEYSDLTGRELAIYVDEQDGVNMKRLMEVYDLSKSMQDQLAQPRVYNY